MRNILIALMILVLLTNFSLAEPIPISECGDYRDGEYYLTNDLITSSEERIYCLHLLNSKLDCRGHKIVCDGCVAIYSSDLSTLENCVIKDSYYGIFVFHFSKIYNTTVENNTYGMWLVSYVDLYKTKIRNNYVGIYELTDFSNLYNSTVYNNYIGIRKFVAMANIFDTHFVNNTIAIYDIYDSATISNSYIYGSYVAIRSNTFLDNFGPPNIIGNTIVDNYVGILSSKYDYDIKAKTVVNNVLNNTINYICGDIDNFEECVPSDKVTLIVYSNYYGSPDGNGFSDTCEDSDKDGYCDYPYDLFGNGYVVDERPLSRYYLKKIEYVYPPPPPVVEFLINNVAIILISAGVIFYIISLFIKF